MGLVQGSQRLGAPSRAALWVVGAALGLCAWGEREATANPGMFRLWQARAGDAARSSGVDLVRPVRFPRISSRINLSDTPEAESGRLGDLDGDGVDEEIGLSLGQVVVLERDLTVRWSSQDLGFARVEQVADLDEDGRAEVLAVTEAGQLHVLSGEDGQSLYDFSLGEGRVALRDLDGDDNPEVLVREGARTLRAYNFAGGQGRLLWEVVEGLPAAGVDVALGDLAGDGSRWSVVALDREAGRFLVYSSASGAARGEPAAPTGRASCGATWIAQADEDPGHELVVTSTRATAADGREASVMVGVYDPQDEQFQFSYDFGPHGATALDVPWGGLADLDGDGAPELVVSIFRNTDEADALGQVGDLDRVSYPSGWVTVAYDPATGVALAALPDRRASAILDPGDGRPVVLVRAAGGSLDELAPHTQSVEAVTLGQDGWERLWGLERARLKPDAEWRHGGCASGGVQPRPARADLDGDRYPEVFVERFMDDNATPDMLQRVAFGTGEPQVLGWRLIEPWQQVELLGQGEGVEGPELRARMGDGFLTGLGEDLQARSRFPLSRFAPTLRAMQDPGNPTSFHVVTDRPDGGVSILDPGVEEDGRLVAAPLWESVGAVLWPALTLSSLPTGESATPLLGDDGGTLQMLDARGEPRWSLDVSARRPLPDTMLYAQLNDDPNEDLVAVVELPDGGLEIEARDGLTGQVFATRPLSDFPGADGSSRFLLLPGPLVQLMRRDDLVLAYGGGAARLEGSDLSTVVELTTGGATELNAVADLDDDGTPEVVFRRVDGTRVARDPDDDALLWEVGGELSSAALERYPGFVYEAALEPGMPGTVHMAVPGAFGDVTLYDGRTGAVRWRACLSGGEVSPLPPDLEPTREACDGAPLSDITTGLIDLGDDFQMLVGAQDGWMYALQVTGARMWSMPFHTPLEAPILADGDNDALADVLAVGANHNVYALRHQHDPTAQVRDVALGEDGQLSDVGTDIDEQNHARGLAFAWEAVRNATIFRVAWMGDDGTLRPYQEIRGQQSFTVQGVELLSGVTYQAFVIARTNTGAISAPVASDGVRLVDQSPPTVTASLLTPARLSHALGGVTTLDVRASDDLGLKWIRVEALAQGADEPVWFSQIPARRAASWEGTPTWEGVDLGGMLVADGVWRLRVEAEDYSGRTASVELEVVLDGTGPTPPVLTAPALGAVLTEAQPRFEGTTDADVEVVVTVGARTCAATADGQGSFGCSLDELLEDGAHSAFAVARDDLGNPSPGASLEFSVDTTPPDAPTVVEPTEGEALVVGALTRFLVRADPEARVQVFLDGGETPICEATAPEGETDTFACSGPAPLELGAHQAYAVAFDDVGLASEPSGTVSFTIIEEEEPGNNGANNANNGANNANNGANNANNENNENNGANNDNNVNNTNNGANNANNADNNGGKNNENNGVNNATANNGTNNATNNGANNNANNNSGEPSTGGGATADEGCGCAVPASPRPAGGALGLGVAALALLWGARRRTR